jgi:hypothetical protein
VSSSDRCDGAGDGTPSLACSGRTRAGRRADPSFRPPGLRRREAQSRCSGGGTSGRTSAPATAEARRGKRASRSRSRAPARRRRARDGGRLRRGPPAAARSRGRRLRLPAGRAGSSCPRKGTERPAPEAPVTIRGRGAGAVTRSESLGPEACALSALWRSETLRVSFYILRYKSSYGLGARFRRELTRTRTSRPLPPDVVLPLHLPSNSRCPAA